MSLWYGYPSDYGASQKGDQVGAHESSWRVVELGARMYEARRAERGVDFLGFDIGPEVGALLMPGRRRRRRRVSLLRGGLCAVSRAVGEGGASLCLGSSVCVLRGWSLFG